MNVRYTLRAQADLEAIFNLLNSRVPSAAQTVKIVIQRRIALLADLWHIAPKTEIEGVFELAIVRYPYKIYFQVEGAEVRLLHIQGTGT